MHSARIAELLEPFLSPAGPGPEMQSLLRGISTYIDILQRWNSRINLTAIRNEEEIVTRHFGESFFAALHLFPITEGRQITRLRVADLGSGAGFPGIPIKLWAPDIALTLIESNQKKATFLREVTRALRFTDVNIKNLRAETISTASFDVVTLRAVERFAKAVPVGMSLVADRGRLALLISSAQLPAAYATVPAQSWEEPLPIPQSDSRVLLISRQRRIGAPEYS